MTTTREAAWAQAHRDLRSDAQHLVRALAVLDGPSISLISAAAALVIPEPCAVEVMSILAADEWGTAAADRFEISICAREYLAELAPTMSAAEVDQVLTRVAAVVQTHAGGAPSPAVCTDVVSVIRAAGRHRRADIVDTVARAAWRSPAVREDLTWCRELAQCGEDAAIANRQPELLVELLNNSAEIYASAGDWPGAERAWLRTLALVEDLGDTVRSTHFFDLLAANYLAWERPHKAVDMLLEIVWIHERAGDPVKTVQALKSAAQVMANANRADAAIEYLKRAEHLLEQLADHSTEVSTLHATVLAELGEVHARSGAINSARTYFHQALTLVVDTDIHATARIRSLQNTLQINT